MRPDQPFGGKPIVLQSASPGPLGGSRVQYDLRRSMAFLDGWPELHAGAAAYLVRPTRGPTPVG